MLIWQTYQFSLKQLNKNIRDKCDIMKGPWGLYRMRGNDFDWEMLLFEYLLCFSRKRLFFLKPLAL